MTNSDEIKEVPRRGEGFDGFMDSLTKARATRIRHRFREHETQPRDEKLELSVGEVYTVWAPSSGEYAMSVIVDETEGQLQVVPLDFAEGEPIENELRIPSGSLGFEADASVWAFGAILREQCVEAIGALESEQLERIRAALLSFRDSDKRAERDPEPGSPAWRHMLRLSDNLIPYFRPTALLRNQAELGGVLDRSLPLSEVTIDEAAELAGVSRATWIAFQNEQISPADSISTKLLAGILREVGLFASESLASLARSSVNRHQAGSVVHGSPALARRRRGSRPRRKVSGDAEAAVTFAESLNAELWS